MIKEMMNPQSKPRRIPIDRPWIKVPRQKLRTSAIGLILNSYNVAKSAATKTVTASSSIQNLEVPRALRAVVPAAPRAQSGDETEAETRCQNSEVAIYFPPTLTGRLSKTKRRSPGDISLTGAQPNCCLGPVLGSFVDGERGPHGRNAAQLCVSSIFLVTR